MDIFCTYTYISISIVYISIEQWDCGSVYVSMHLYSNSVKYSDHEKKKLKINHNLAVTVSLESNRLNGSSNLKIDSDSDL